MGPHKRAKSKMSWLAKPCFGDTRNPPAKLRVASIGTFSCGTSSSLARYANSQPCKECRIRLMRIPDRLTTSG